MSVAGDTLPVRADEEVRNDPSQLMKGARRTRSAEATDGAVGVAPPEHHHLAPVRVLVEARRLFLTPLSLMLRQCREGALQASSPSRRRRTVTLSGMAESGR